MNFCHLFLLVISTKASAFCTTDPTSSISFKLSTSFQTSMNDDVNETDDEGEILARATVKIDDGGSDLTNRFKYKVNALMGVFDPTDGADDERQDGNILNAMVKFPVRYTFNVVGKTSGDTEKLNKYVDDVTKIVLGTSGDEKLSCQITPRGKNYTKLQCEAEVQSITMINTIYDELASLELTAMRF